jgi:hypothetical protein
MTEKTQAKAKRFQIKEIRSEYIWAIAFLLFVTTTLHPLMTKVIVTPGVQDIYNRIQALPRGSIIISGPGGVFSFMLECSAAFIACIKQMARQGLRLISLPLEVEYVPFYKYCIDAAGVDESAGGPWKYGRDYVALPYIPGGTTAMLAFLNNVRSIIYTDIYGTPIDQIPMMSDVINYKSFAYWVDTSGYYIPTLSMWQVAQYNLPLIGFIHAYYYAVYGPYMAMYPGKVFLTNGIVGGAEYEELMNYSGLGQIGVDSYQLVSIYFFVIMILGNAVMFLRRGEEE